MPIYECRKCGQTVESSSMPGCGSCPKGGCHSWMILCNRPGNTTWQCRKCHKTLNCETIPGCGSCPGGGCHSWVRL